MGSFLLFAGAAYGLGAALCWAVPQKLAVETFGEHAKSDRDLMHAYGTIGALVSISSLTALALGMGKDGATAVMCGFSVIPVRMGMDFAAGKPPPQGHDWPLHGHRLPWGLQHVSQDVSARAASADLPLTALITAAVLAQRSTLFPRLLLTFQLSLCRHNFE